MNGGVPGGGDGIGLMTALVMQSGRSLLLSAHLICIDLAMVGPLVALFLAWRMRRGGDEASGRAGRWLMHLSWQALAVGIVLGLLAGLLLWFHGSDPFFAALYRVPPRRLYWGIVEVAFYFCLIMPCAFAWDSLNRRPLLLGVLAVAAATNLIYHFPTLFVIVGELTSGPQGDSLMTSAEFRGLAWSPRVLSQSAHYVVSAAAVVGGALLVYARQVGSREDRAGDARRIAIGGARLALSATLLQIPVGLWLLEELPAGPRDVVLGVDAVGTGLFIAALAMALGLLHFLVAVALGDAGRREIRGSIVMLVLVIVLMTGTLRRARTEGEHGRESGHSDSRLPVGRDREPTFGH